MIRSKQATISSAFRKTPLSNSVAGRLPRRSASRRKASLTKPTMLPHNETAAAFSSANRLSFQLLPQGHRMGHGLVQLVDVELALRAADHQGGDPVPDQIRQSATFAHELVDADQ